MIDSPQSDEQKPPSDVPAESSSTQVFGRHGWEPELRAAKRSIVIADGLLLEWRDEISEGSSDLPRARLIAIDGNEVLEIETPRECGWIRLVVDLCQPTGSEAQRRRELFAQMTLQVVEPQERGAIDLEPMIALRTGTAGSPRREGNFTTRAKLPLQPGQWNAVRGTFRLQPTADSAIHDIVINLPRGARLRLSQLEIDWLQSSSVEALPDAVEVVVPFSATPFSPGSDGPIGSLRDPITPSLEDVAGLLSVPAADCGSLIATLLTQSGSPAAALLLECSLAMLGRELALPAASRAPRSTRLITTELLRESMGRAGIGATTYEDRIAIDFLGDFPADTLRFQLRPQRIAVELSQNPSAEDLAHWQAHLERGAISNLSHRDPSERKDEERSEDGELTGVLSILPDTRISPIGLAILSGLMTNDASCDVLAEIAEPQSGSWSSQEVETGSEFRQTAAVGVYRPAGAAPGKESMSWVICRTAPKRPAIIEGTDIELEKAYALILRLDDDLKLDSLLNFENCRVYSSARELHQALQMAPRRVLMKPVVVLSKPGRLAEDHLIHAVSAHWRFGGKYVLSRCTLAYSSAEGKISLAQVREVAMQPAAALASVLSMPASEVAAQDNFPPVFIPSNGLALAVPYLPMDPSDLSLLERQLGVDKRTSHDDEALARAGQIDAGMLSSMPLGPTNWPISELIAKKVGDYRKLRHLLADSTNEMSVATASGVLAFLSKDSTDLLKLRRDIGQFLLALSQRPDIVLQLDKAEVVTLVERSREVRSSDAIAHNLSLISVELMRRNIDLLFPLFEFLACSLPSEALSTTFGFASHDLTGASDRYVLRLAECMRRYGTATTQALLITALHAATPNRLKNPDLLRTFAPLLNSPLLSAVSAQVGNDVVRRIRASIPAVDKFQALVQAGDREGALRIFLDRQALAGVDFMHWMNNLRALSNELREMSLPVAEIGISNCSSLPRRRLASIIFSDMESLTLLDQNRELEFQSDLNAIARNILGDNRMLNDLVAAPFNATGYVPMQIEGETTGDVFRFAQKSTEGLPPITSGPLITVIMSAFNPDLALMQTALDSIRAQTWKNVEVIVVDDASEPESAAGIRKLVDAMPGCRLIRLDENAGPYIGRNLALQSAQGEFIAIHDADDWAHPQRFAAQMAMLQEKPEARVATTLHLRVDRAGHIQLERQFSLFGDGPMTSLFRRSVFDTVGLFAKVRSRGDVEMRERIAGYFGHQALAVLPLPMMLCFADSATLSQKTAANSAEYLQLWRSNISRRGSMTSLFRDSVPLADWHQLSVPLVLRAPDLEDMK